MLNIGISEMLVASVVAILVLGPDRLPEVMRFLGRTYGKIRSASNELRRAFQLEVDRAEAERRSDEIRRRAEAVQARKLAESGSGGTARRPEGEE